MRSGRLAGLLRVGWRFVGSSGRGIGPASRVVAGRRGSSDHGSREIRC